MKRSGRQQGIWKNKFGRYLMVGVIAYIATIFVLFLFSDVLGFPASIVGMVWIPILFIVRFFVYDKFVFT
ncbi:MAG: hypothetical protein DRO95_03675 [Candidatus Altiarchaeales archaeon]|nr:MAG: hypothetical protein DRO95_03675 [Candidatus Altiarchaeales archaeon]HDO81959.1 hypothetical protein [Candidatus Altiarchaeales archaeon]HEX54608.1 hypothetical protein [Candidatus Altiarchaeales archaeon]